MSEIRYMTWEESQAEHASERRNDARAIASGEKSPWQVQIENSFVPVEAKIEVDFDGFLKRRAIRDA